MPTQPKSRDFLSCVPAAICDSRRRAYLGAATSAWHAHNPRRGRYRASAGLAWGTSDQKYAAQSKSRALDGPSPWHHFCGSRAQTGIGAEVAAFVLCLERMEKQSFDASQLMSQMGSELTFAAASIEVSNADKAVIP